MAYDSVGHSSCRLFYICQINVVVGDFVFETWWTYRDLHWAIRQVKLQSFLIVFVKLKLFEAIYLPNFDFVLWLRSSEPSCEVVTICLEPIVYLNDVVGVGWASVFNICVVG